MCSSVHCCHPCHLQRKLFALRKISTSCAYSLQDKFPTLYTQLLCNSQFWLQLYQNLCNHYSTMFAHIIHLVRIWLLICLVVKILLRLQFNLIYKKNKKLLLDRCTLSFKNVLQVHIHVFCDFSYNPLCNCCTIFFLNGCTLLARLVGNNILK